MTATRQSHPDDIEFGSVLAAIRRALPRLLVITAVIVGLVFAGLALAQPRYSSVTRILIGKADTVFTKPKGTTETTETVTQKIDKEAVQSQVQVILSRNLMAKLAQELDLARRPEFNSALPSPGALNSILRLLGIGGPRPGQSEQDRVLEALTERLRIFQIKDSRVITVEMGGAGMIALYPMTGAQAKRAILRGSLSLITNIGRLIRSEQAANRNPADRLAAELGGVRLFEGRVTDVDRRTEGGFARGQAKIEGLESYQGRTLTLKFQNEFLMAETEDGSPRAMTPDLICLLDLETGQPITTEQMAYGYRVIVFGLPCDPKWRTEHGLSLVGPGYFGYKIDYQPIEKLTKTP